MSSPAVAHWRRRLPLSMPSHRPLSRRVFVGAVVLTALAPATTHPGMAAQPAPVRVTLGEAARRAAERNTGIEVARARVAQADARARQRRGALYPDLAAGVLQSGRTINSATFGFSFANPATGQPLLNPNGEIIGPVETIDLRYRLSQPLVDLGKWQGWKAAQAGAVAEQAAVDVQADAAAAAAAVVYVRAARADAQLAARRADSALAADLVRIARDQLAAGVGIALDVTRAESQLATVRAQIIAARSERDRTLLELRRALSLAPDAPLELADSLAAMPLGDAMATVAASSAAAAIDARPDVRALRALESAQSAQLKAIRWERTPQLGLLVEQGVIGKHLDRLLPTYTWGVQLSVGLFDGFRREARAEEQTAVARETHARLRDLETQTALDVRTAQLDLAAAAEQLDAVRERLRLAELEVSQAQDRFRAGVAGNADVITALLSLNQARTLRNDALASYQTARVALARALGAVRTLP